MNVIYLFYRPVISFKTVNPQISPAALIRKHFSFLSPYSRAALILKLNEKGTNLKQNIFYTVATKKQSVFKKDIISYHNRHIWSNLSQTH